MIGPVDVVLVRMDKIGDLVLSLPVDQHPALAGRRVHWFVTRGLRTITTRAEPARASTAFPRAFRPWRFARAYRWFKRHRPRTVFFLHNPWWISMAAWAAGVPERIGRRSQWHSFLFVNLPIHQKRSRADRHESDFNFDLVEWGSVRLGLRATRELAQLKTRALVLNPVEPERTVATLGLGAREYRVVHPGMAGSALNWPPEFFAELITRLAREAPVVVTGTKADQPYLSALDAVRDLPNVHWCVERLSFEQLLDVLATARAVVAPSTGVLHLAASLGAPALGIYSPRGVEHPRRWGPKGPRATFVTAREEAGSGPDVMRTITVDDVEARLREVERESSDAFAHALRAAGADRVAGPDVRALSDFFLANDGAATPWDEPFAAPAYLAYFLPLNYVRLRAVLNELRRFVPADQIGTVVDFGSGSGAVQFALEDEAWLPPRDLYCVEINRRATAAHRALAERRAGRWTPRFEKPTRPGALSLGIFSYSFLEIAPTLDQLAPFDHLLVIEPSTRRRGRALMEWRRRLIEAGYVALAPCTHDHPCPLLTHSNKDWCHHRVGFDPPAWWAALEDQLPMKNRTLTYSYLLVSRVVRTPDYRHVGRVIGDTMKERGKTRQMVCRGPEREFLSWLHRDGEPPAVPRGALIDGLATTEPKGGELRVTAASRLDVQP